jgi:hypothetical protein
MPMTEILPAWYDDIDVAGIEGWRMLVRGVGDRRSGLHTPMVATLGRDGRPRNRVVVLRAVDPENWTIRFHTDRRSEKFAELVADPRCALTAYDAGTKLQFRLEGKGRLHTEDAVAEAAWSQSREMSRACYGVTPGPGQVVDAGSAFVLPADANEAAAGRANFCAVTIAVERFELLYLAFSGHRRALFRRDGDRVAAFWLVP